MSEYLIRTATKEDLPFLAELIIAAEKGNSDKLSFTTLFNLSEEEVRNLIITMLDEEIDGCEFSLSSYLITEYNGLPVAGFGSWIEGLDGRLPSKILKSNLISYTFPKQSIEFLKTKAHIIKDVLAEREPMTLQLEYLFVSENHRGKRLANGLIQKIEENALGIYPGLEKAHVQLFKNNINAVGVYKKNGFEIVKSYKSNNVEIFNYLPHDEKYVMEKKLKK
jgi:ribosomal protein S18 acetylase RimI-like enzyme